MTASKTNYSAKIQDLKDSRAYSLAGLADCMSPDSLESVGAIFLGRVRDDVLEMVEGLDDFDGADDFARMSEDETHMIADGAVPIYTAEKWATFTDLGAWQTDVSDYIGGEEDLDKLGSIALYEIARTLADAILAEITEAIREDDESEDDES